MSDKKTITYSSADIERYHKGLMTPGEMHALEKAALDDPFLSDAMEGYQRTPVNAQTEIAVLNQRLNERIEDKKVIPLKKANLGWLRIAALLIIITGAGLLTYNYVLYNKKSEVAAIQKSDTAVSKTTDTAKGPAASANADTIKPDGETEHLNAVPGDRVQKETEPLVDKTKKSEKKDVNPAKTQSDVAAKSSASRVIDLKDSETEELKSDTVKYNFTTKAQPTAVSPPVKTDDVARLSRLKNEQAFDKNSALKGYTVTKASAAQNKINYFRGQVLDANNSPLPFANVMIVPDHIGTYTDVKGYFVLISPDSALDVRVRSVGFENDTAKLFTGASANAIVLKPDFGNTPSTVLSKKKINIQRKREDNMRVEEPEPEDGWSNYDTYLSNNIEITDAIKMKATPSSEVELSFDVNEIGEPVNVKVERSVCKECDAEAIRLLKEGPKWKGRKTKRAKISVAFNNE